MGLCISGIKITKINKEPSDDTMETFVLRGFERSLLDSEILVIDYEDENYECVGDGPSMAYSSYNRFRSDLCEAALGLKIDDAWEIAHNLPDDQAYPSAIYHIINFADNEGFIGPTAVKELDVYFKENGDRIREKLNSEERSFNQFNQLAECVSDTAKENGYLEFS